MPELPTPPPDPNLGNLVLFFSEVKIQDLKVSLELKILYILYDKLYIYIYVYIYIQPKEQFKVQIIVILEYQGVGLFRASVSFETIHNLFQK